MTHANNRMNPQHFGTDPADIPIWIQINPEIRIWILDRVLALVELAVSDCSDIAAAACWQELHGKQVRQNKLNQSASSCSIDDSLSNSTGASSETDMCFGDY